MDEAKDFAESSPVNSSNSSANQPYAVFLVLRLGADTQNLGYQLVINQVDDQTVSKHPQLQQSLHEEDVEKNNVDTFCNAHSDICHSSSPRYVGPYSVTVDYTTVSSLLDDPDLHFRNLGLPSNFKETQLDIHGIVYSLGLQCSVEDCK